MGEMREQREQSRTCSSFAEIPEQSSPTRSLSRSKKTEGQMWNLWHGCHKKSEGCLHCYVYRREVMPRLELIKKYLPELEYMYASTRVDDIRNKTVEQLKQLRAIGVNEISLGVESGDDWTLQRINKGYTSQDILEQCHKLEEAGIQYWVTFLNGVAGREHSHDHAVNSAKIFNQLKPMLVGTGGLTLFPGTPLLEEAERGEFTPLSEKEMLEELRTFVEHLTVDCSFITHHTIAANLTGPHFLSRKQSILAALEDAIEHGDMNRMAAIRSNKRTL